MKMSEDENVQHISAALKTLLNYSSCLDEENTKSFSGDETNFTFLTSNVSYFRGSEIHSHQRTYRVSELPTIPFSETFGEGAAGISHSDVSTNISKFSQSGFHDFTKENLYGASLPDMKSTTLLETRFSFETPQISDDDFFDSDNRKKMILNDNTLKNPDLNCTGCSSWIPTTSRKIRELPFIENNWVTDDSTISVGEFIGIRTETLGSLTDNRTGSKAYFGCNASTPAGTKSVDTPNDDVFDICQPNTLQQAKSTIVRTPMSPVLLYSTPNKKIKDTDVFRYYIDSSCYKRIQKLRSEEQRLAKSTSQEQRLAKFASQEFVNPTSIEENTFTDADKTIENGNGVEEWIVVQPQELVLDSMAKGNRILVSNPSTQDIKFKTDFDVRIINVNPICGTVKAKSQMGLRVLLSRLSRDIKQATETTIKIINGKLVKTVLVKIIKEKKSKPVARKRSYILY